MNDSASIWRRVCCRISACDSDVKDFQVLTATFSPESVQVHQYSRVAFPDHERLGENSNAVVVFGFAVTIACIFVQMISRTRGYGLQRWVVCGAREDPRAICIASRLKRHGIHILQTQSGNSLRIPPPEPNHNSDPNPNSNQRDVHDSSRSTQFPNLARITLWAFWLRGRDRLQLSSTHGPRCQIVTDDGWIHSQFGLIAGHSVEWRNTCYTSPSNGLVAQSYVSSPV